ncbi:unnamed protein product, partial [Rotaria sp. Silwood2]
MPVRDTAERLAIRDSNPVKPSSKTLVSKYSPQYKIDRDYDSDPFDDTIISPSKSDFLDISDYQHQALSILAKERSFTLPEPADPSAFDDAFIQKRHQVIQNQIYRKLIDQWANMTTVQQLVAAINFYTRNKSLVDRIWFVFYWIVNNIAYDPVSLIPGRRAQQSAERVFRTRKGVCAGYSNLLQHLCTQLGIKCVYIGGFTKDEIMNNQETPLIRTNHAWNAVEISHHWYLLEPTWAAGYLTEKNTKFERRLDFSYFLARPDQFIYSHLPKDSKWQFLKHSISMLQHTHLPLIYPAYFSLGLELISPCISNNMKFVPGKPFGVIIIRAPSDIEIYVFVMLNDEEVIDGYEIRHSKNRDFRYIYIAPAHTGMYTVTIYGYHPLNNEGARVIKVKFNVTHLRSRLVKFAKKWHTFYEHGFEVLYPRNTGTIQLKSPNENHCQILIRTSAHTQLNGQLRNHAGKKINGGERIYYDQGRDVWR